MRIGRRTAAGALAAGLLGPLRARAADYPDHPILMIVPFGAGGGTDLLARTFAAELAQALGGSIVVEDRPGANGAIGSSVVARAAPDGYTLLFTASSTYSLNPNLMKNPLFDQVKDLVPVAMIGRSPWYVTVPADSPFKTAADLAAYGKANPGKLVFPYWQSSGLVTGEAFARVAGFTARRIPYKGQVEATTDFLGGRLQVMVTDTLGARAPVANGNMRLLGATTVARVSAFPDVPTLREQGYDVVTDSMLAMFAPAATPKPIVDRINAEVAKLEANSPTIKQRLDQIGLEPATMSPAEADAFVRSELVRWADLIQHAGLQKE